MPPKKKPATKDTETHSSVINAFSRLTEQGSGILIPKSQLDFLGQQG